MKTFKVINNDGDIEIFLFKKANVIFHTGEYDETEDICVHREIFNIFDLVSRYEQLKANYERLYNENCKLREKHNINDISLLDENYRLENNWNKLKEIAKSQSGFKKRADLKGGLWFEVDDLLDKMRELEQGSCNNE